MKKGFIIIIITLLSLNSYSQLIHTLDTLTIKDGYEIVLRDDYSWEYLNHDSIARIIAYNDSIELRNYILTKKVLKVDTNTLFTNNWDNDILWTCGGYNYKKANDSIAIPLLLNDSAKFVAPCKGALLSEFGMRWGRLHAGLDLDLETGDSVVASFSGKIRYAKYNTGGYGNLIIIRHHNGLETYYAHLSKILVDTNQYVEAGDTIGLGGCTGRCYGAHLHWEIRYNDNPFDPLTIYDNNSYTLRTDTLILVPDNFEEIKTITQATWYTIKSGDTLGQIAGNYGTSVNSICRLNSISATTTLRIGRKLRVR